MDDLSFVKPRNSLRTKEKKDKLKRAIRARVTQISNYQQLRSNGTIDQELLLMVANCLENVVKKKYGINKKTFALEILAELYPNLTPQETENASQTIQFLFDNALIQLVPLSDKVKHIVWDWIKRKVL